MQRRQIYVTEKEKYQLDEKAESRLQHLCRCSVVQNNHTIRVSYGFVSFRISSPYDYYAFTRSHNVLPFYVVLHENKKKKKKQYKRNRLIVIIRLCRVSQQIYSRSSCVVYYYCVSDTFETHTHSRSRVHYYVRTSCVARV